MDLQDDAARHMRRGELTAAAMVSASLVQRSARDDDGEWAELFALINTPAWWGELPLAVYDLPSSASRPSNRQVSRRMTCGLCMRILE